MNIKERLNELYRCSGKHANYQIVYEKLNQYLDVSCFQTKSRYERERLDYILQHVVVKKKNILDIGGNTGYFTFTLLDKGARTVHYYEGNPVHAEFVKLAATLLNVSNRIRITNGYYLFAANDAKYYDIVLLLNVLHHLGDDYGDRNLSMDCAKKKIIDQINSLASRAEILILQLGYNWKGNPKLGFFQNGTKKEMIDFIREGTKKHWVIKNIGVPELCGESIKYMDLNESNIKRMDYLGEFLNRPIFIMKARR